MSDKKSTEYKWPWLVAEEVKRPAEPVSHGIPVYRTPDKYAMPQPPKEPVSEYGRKPPVIQKPPTFLQQAGGILYLAVIIAIMFAGCYACAHTHGSNPTYEPRGY